MTTTVNMPVPERVLAIGAHPDDIEFGCGATLAKWAVAGAAVQLCVCTDGAKGTWDPTADTRTLVATREQEQRDAAAALGADAVVFLRYVDGELRNDLDSRAAVCRVIREYRPDVVLTHDPWHPYRLHPDHHQAGMITIDGIVAARDPHFFPEQGLAPHRPAHLLLFEAPIPNHVERVDGYVERKIEALLCHRSQWQSTMAIDEKPDDQRAAFVQLMNDEAQADGLRAGLRAGEAFRRLNEL